MTEPTLSSREAARRALADDILTGAEATGVPLESGPLDGIVVVSMGSLKELVDEALEVKLPIASERFAEVSTPAMIEVDAICPECGESVSITGRLFPRLTVEDGTTELACKWSAKPTKHLHGQRTLREAEGQVSLDESIDDLRIRILRAVDEVDRDHQAEHEPGPPPSLESIAQRLELATDGDRGDLEESLYAYSQVDPPLVEVIRAKKGAPVTYRLTEDGLSLITVAQDEEDAAD